jgi:hypothetical protein
MSTPEQGFHYFDSPESSDDMDVIAYTFLYCSVAVGEWKKYRRDWLQRGATLEQLDLVEKNAIEVFRAVRDVIQMAIDTDNVALMSQPRLLQRFVHAHAYLALHANPGGIPEYRDIIAEKLPSGAELGVDDFCKAIWDGEWNQASGPMPSEATRTRAMQNKLEHDRDGQLNSRGRRDLVATACTKTDLDRQAKKPDPALGHLTEEEEQRIAEDLTAIGKRAGLKKEHIKFLRDLAFGKKNRSDNPSAARMILDPKRKRPKLKPAIQNLLMDVQSKRKKRLK